MADTILNPAINPLLKSIIGNPAPVDMIDSPALTSTIAAPAPSAPSLGASILAPVSLPNQTQTQKDTTLRDRYINEGSGVDQIKNPLLKGLARAGDIAASVFAPNAAAFIPGTSLHHNMLVNQATRNVEKDQDQEKNVADIAGTQATTERNKQLTELMPEQLDLKQQAQDAKETHAQDQLAATYAKLGYKQVANPDGTKAWVEDETSPVAIRNKAAADLQAARSDEVTARGQLERSKNNPDSPAYRQAQARIQAAQQNANTAAGKLGLAGKNFELKAFGTVGGEAPAGALLDDNGHPVGTAFQRNVMPTGTERNKGDMAASAAEQLSDIKSIMQKHATLFGPGYGQTSAFRQWIGSQDPDAQKFMAARTIAADHLAGTFGGRSEAALTALDHAIGQFKDNPTAAIAGVDQLSGANQRFVKAGTPRTVGSKAGNEAQGKTESIPEAAAKQLQEGVQHTFGNGQVWTKQNGKPVRVK